MMRARVLGLTWMALPNWDSQAKLAAPACVPRRARRAKRARAAWLEGNPPPVHKATAAHQATSRLGGPLGVGDDGILSREPAGEMRKALVSKCPSFYFSDGYDFDV